MWTQHRLKRKRGREIKKRNSNLSKLTDRVAERTHTHKIDRRKTKQNEIIRKLERKLLIHNLRLASQRRFCIVCILHAITLCNPCSMHTITSYNIQKYKHISWYIYLCDGVLFLLHYWIIKLLGAFSIRISSFVSPSLSSHFICTYMKNEEHATLCPGIKFWNYYYEKVLWNVTLGWTCTCTMYEPTKPHESSKKKKKMNKQKRTRDERRAMSDKEQNWNIEIML